MARTFFKHWLIILVTSILFIAVSYSTTGSLLEDRLYNQISTLLAGKSHEDSPLLSISFDDISYEHYGSQLSSYHLLADLINKLRRDGAKTIVLSLPLVHTQLQSQLNPLNDNISELPKQEQEAIRKWLPKIDPDVSLQAAIDKAGNVVLMSVINNTPLPVKETVLPDSFQIKSTLPEDTGWDAVNYWFHTPSLRHNGMPILPDSLFAGTAAAIGFWRPQAARAAATPLLYSYNDNLIPSLAMAGVAHFRGARIQDIGLNDNNVIELSHAAFSTGSAYHLVPYPGAGSGNERTLSLVKYMRSSTQGKKVKSSLVLVGVDQNAKFRDLVTEFHAAPPLQTMAAAINSLLVEKTVYQPSWFHLGQRLAVLLLAVYLLLLTTRTRQRTALIVQLIFIVAVSNAWIFALIFKQTWLPYALPILFLLLTHIMLYLRDSLYSRLRNLQTQVIQARSGLARNLQSSGQLDQAYDELVKCPPLMELREPLYQLALDMERRRFFNKAQEIYGRIMEIDTDYRDIRSRKANLEKVPTPAMARHANNAATVIGTMVADASAMEKPMLGRYQLEKELGQGAMGVVYLGVDPKIGRKVAIKTLSLMDEFDAENLQEVQERFFREAEAAGRLDHPNIVTIYDAGEEHDLAYIAMDFAPGKSLDHYIKDKEQLSVKNILEIGCKVALALNYAHERNVVHRDIKPGNIMYDPQSDSVKVTDFGIAFLSDDSRTRTGIILGSPSYMSPEQVAGKKIDGRSDLYSLAVSLYQLLTGKLPFVGDSLANLMYKITNDKPESIKKIRKDVPVCVVRLINKAMSKEVDKRYGSGQEMAEAINKCLQQL